MVIASYQPVGPEATAVLLEGLREMVFLRLLHPLLAFQHPVVIGQGEKVVTVVLVPIGDGFWEIVAIAPQRMGVEITLPPTSLGGRRQGHHGQQAGDNRDREAQNTAARGESSMDHS